MKISLRAVSATAVGVLTAATLVSVPATANAASVANKPCSSPGRRHLETTNKVFAWDVAQRTREENYSGRSAKITFEITQSTSRTNSVKGSVEGKYSVDALFSSFEATVKVEMGTAHTKTQLTKTTRSYTLASGDNYVFGQGTGRWTGIVHAYQCQRISRDGNYAYKQFGQAKVTGYTGKTNSVIACKKKAPKNTFAAKLKSLGC